MDPYEHHHLMARRAATMVVAMLSFLMTRLRAEEEPIVYGPRSVAKKHRQNTLQMIYNSTDAECLAMLRMTRAPFSIYAACLEKGPL